MSVSTGTNLVFEDKLWSATDKLRVTIDAAEYKHVVPGLIFLKYIPDDGVVFEAKIAKLAARLYQQRPDYLELDAVIRRNLEVLGYGE